jgi:hypothetical protein
MRRSMSGTVSAAVYTEHFGLPHVDHGRDRTLLP